MALVFTALSNSMCALLLWAVYVAGDAHPREVLSVWHLIAVAMVSIGLYGFGMSLNDIIDRRRDEQIAAHRPLPSGRIGVLAAEGVCATLALIALAGAVWLWQLTATGVMSLLLVMWTFMLIVFYDVIGKYLVAPGLLTLGLIRFFHACIAAPQLPLLWHPLLLLNHVAIVSMIAYAWEQKRPTLTRLHVSAVIGGLLFVDVFCVLVVGLRRMQRLNTGFFDALWVEGALVLPLLAVIVFAALVLFIRQRHADSARAGQSLMLLGLLWLIVYDACFVVGYVSWRAALLLLTLLPIAYVSVQLMRWWSRVIALSQKPEYQRAR
jgi:hypothetical protein